MKFGVFLPISGRAAGPDTLTLVTSEHALTGLHLDGARYLNLGQQLDDPDEDDELRHA